MGGWEGEKNWTVVEEERGEGRTLGEGDGKSLRGRADPGGDVVLHKSGER